MDINPPLLNLKRAAEYVGMGDHVAYFRNVALSGRGPAYVKTSYRQIFFRTDDLDRWMATWSRVEPTP